MSSIGKLMKQAARMQQQMEKVQSELAQRTVEASSGGGAVKAVAKCDGTLASIMRRDWRGRWKVRHEDEATLAGMWVLAESARASE